MSRRYRQSAGALTLSSLVLPGVCFEREPRISKLFPATKYCSKLEKNLLGEKWEKHKFPNQLDFLLEVCQGKLKILQIGSYKIPCYYLQVLIIEYILQI